jgi:hypothetical protein
LHSSSPQIFDIDLDAVLETVVIHVDGEWRAPKSVVEPTWGFNYVELRKVGTWGPLLTSSTKRGRGAC